MSHLSELLAGSPIAVPADLDRAWAWMADRGHAINTDHGYFLTPYTGTRQLGVVFTDSLSVDQWFGDDLAERAALDRLLPIAEIDGAGSMAALWQDEDALRVVALESEGEAYVLADSPLDFLRLCAIGYPELTSTWLGAEPDDEESIAAVADFRAWLSEEFEVAVPTEWPAADEDDFTDWVAKLTGTGPEPVAAQPVVPTVPAELIGGDAAVILGALGVADGAERIASLLGVPDTTARTLTKVGLEVAIHRKAPETVHLSLTAEPRKPAYPRAANLFGTPDLATSPAEVIALLGTPERQGEIAPGSTLTGTTLKLRPETWVRYAVATAAGVRYLRFAFGEFGLERLTFMDLTRSPHLL